MTDTPTPFLRFVQRYESLTRMGQFGQPETYGHKLIKVLQQKWLIAPDGGTQRMEWRDVQMENEHD